MTKENRGAPGLLAVNYTQRACAAARLLHAGQNLALLWRSVKCLPASTSQHLRRAA
jgi:hypothetical protein